MLVVATELVKVILTRTLPAGTGGSEDAMALIDHSQLEAVARRISSNKAKKLVAVMTAACFAPTAIGTIIGDRPVVTRLATQNVSAPSRIASRSGMTITSVMVAVGPIGATETIPLLEGHRTHGSRLEVNPMPGMNLT